MSKNITLPLILFVLLFSQCTKLEENPKGLLAPEAFFKSPPDVEAAVLGAYAEWASVPLGRDLFLTVMLRSDMVDIGDRNTNGDRIAINDFAMDANNTLTSGVWSYLYRSIAAANTAIEGAMIAEGDAELLTQLEAEGRFIRAFSYFYLVRLFGDVPYLAKSIESAAELESSSRTPEEEIYGYIIEDLIFAKQNLPEMHSANVRNRATAGTATTVLADVYLTRGAYADAAAEARDVISKAGQYNYQLEANYQDLYNGDLAGSINELIFSIDWHNTLDANNYNVDWMIAQTRIRDYGPRSLSVPVPSLAVYQSWDARDYRRQVAFEDTVLIDGVRTALTETNFTAPRPHIAKYFRFPGPQDGGDDRRGDNDYIFYRYADVLLMAAEAIAETEGATAEAIGYINQIRERARFDGMQQRSFPENVQEGISTDAFIALVREERRLELSFEFKRWFDIKRWGILTEAFTQPDSYENWPVDPARDYLFPIPQTEVDVTGFRQNSGY